MRSNLLKSLSAVFACGLLVFAFQNCGKAGFDSAIDTTENLASVGSDTAAPFAFNATFDQITYNSCFGAGLSTNAAYFTVKAGSYDGGGVNLTSNFITYVNSKLKPQYPSTTVTVEQMKSYVGETVENNSATLQMALRTRGAPQQVRNPTGSNPALNVDYVNLMTDLTDDRIMEPVFRSLGGVVNYFPLAATAAQRVMEAKITYNNDEGVAYSLRNDLSNNGMLALTYTGPTGTSAFAARMPSSTTDTSIAYGRGYTMLFAADIAPLTQAIAQSTTVAPNSRNPNNILVGIQETDLANPAANSGATWSCAQGRRYAIVKAADSATYCPADSIDRMGDANYRRELEIVRRHLPASQWDVSIDRRCVVPKSGTCYNNAAGTAEEAVEYDQRNECYQGLQGLANPAIAKRCAQYISICLRN
ncbi:MAG: hypothetical protein JSU04_01510 [Bdellovibrionales bacterium]|nr:hypothetical protein [Bdellovibrionales bacterium]